MSTSLTRLDLTEIFCDVDDFYHAFETRADVPLALPYDGQAKPYRSRLSISEVMTIVITFHGSGYRTFKDFYTCHILPHWQEAFPDLVSYTRFVELVPSSVMALACYLQTTFGKLTGISFIDATSIEVCHPNRAHNHRVLKLQSGWGKSSVKWYFGLKLHLIINDCGELLAAALTPGNTDERVPVPQMAKQLTGKLFGDKGYVSQALFEKLYEQGLELIYKRRKNMTNQLMKLIDKVLLRKRAVIESVNDQLKNICQIEHSRHRSGFNFVANLLGGLIAYSYHPMKPSLDLTPDELKALPAAIV